MPRRSTHPEIYLYKRTRRDGVTIYARGPLVGRHVNLTNMGITTMQLARKWAEKQSKARRLRRAGLGIGLTVEHAVSAYVEDLDRGDLAKNTKVGQAIAANWLLEILGARTPVGAITRATLQEVRRWVLDRGNTRGTKQTHLLRAGRVIRSWHEQDLVPLIDRDAIFYAFHLGGREVRNRPRCLDHGEIVAMLGASDHPLPRWLLLTGQRVREALQLRWEHVRLDARVIDVPGSITKTGRAREIQLRVCPTIEDWLAGPCSACGDRGWVERRTDRGYGKAENVACIAHPIRDSELIFGGQTYDSVRRLLSYHSTKGGKKRQADGPIRLAVPGLKWKDLRSTCASYLHSMKRSPLSMQQAALQLGHSTQTAERDYIRSVLTIPDGASTLEEAMRLVSANAHSCPGNGKVIRVS